MDKCYRGRGSVSSAALLLGQSTVSYILPGYPAIKTKLRIIENRYSVLMSEL